MPSTSPAHDLRTAQQRRADWNNPAYAGSTCKARRSGDVLVISIGATSFQVEPDTARKLAEQILNAL